MDPMPRVPSCRVGFVTDCSSKCVAEAVQVGNPDALHNLGRTLQAEAGARLRGLSRVEVANSRPDLLMLEVH